MIATNKPHFLTQETWDYINSQHGPIRTYNHSEVETLNVRAYERNKDKLIQTGFNGRKSLLDHRIGVMGEQAVGDHYGVKPDFRVFGRSGDKHAPDIILPDGRTIDVKTRKERGFDFAMDDDDPKKMKADYCVLCYQISENEIEIFGWADRKTFEDRGEKIDGYGYGSRYVLKPEFFKPMETFK